MEDEAPDAGYALLEEYDQLHKARWMLNAIAEAAPTPEYCGIPMPVEGQRLIVEPRHPAAELFKKLGDDWDAENDPPLEGATIINTFFSTKLHSDVVIWRDKDGKYEWGVLPGVHHLRYDLDTMACSSVWSIEAEAKAQQLLGTLVTHEQMRRYVLTGMFVESSQRSNVMYVFRRLKPTVAISKGGISGGSVKILAALCLHPIGYYAGSWAGSMVPTDDVVAHLLLMRSDEHMFWRRSNQHPPFRKEAGL